MLNNEFDAITRLFQERVTFTHPLTQLANGDDASVHQIPHDMELVISTDTAVSGVHWPEDMALDVAANRAVCAALSDLAAMGAKATWIWLAIMAKDTTSLQIMSHGIVQACLDYQLELAGGDTVSSPINIINVTVGGLLPKGTAMTRGSAHEHDEVWLIGDLGLSTLGLDQWLTNKHDGIGISSFQHVKPQLDAGENIRNIGVQCCIDISDGLLQDTSHITQASHVSIAIDVEKLQALPAHKILIQVDEELALKRMIGGGEDYALLLTAPISKHTALLKLGAHPIGQCSPGHGVKLLHHGQEVANNVKGYDHFG